METLRYVEPGHPDSLERCPVCASHGVVSVTRGVEIAPGVRQYYAGQGACPRCVRLGFIPADYGYLLGELI